ncbi:NAD(P)H-hydrate dehydratase [Methylovulum sp.]|uniref:NAD(P)H-hydrate dehydratase n=1 Tax=Methylovulum sp. TaxID=1916980 RepID=UPI002616350B|nr:NAD(P)H-hydrate dehydratase [Methylovulum sp.]MDD5124977.1 NAD(P)H-hydrate dehydratase [Methylovulum sp.]
MQKLPHTLYRTDQVNELECIAINEYGFSSFNLMTKAGYEVFQWITKKWPKAQSVAVFCGSGNNAGDGYIVASLAQQAGKRVCVYALATAEKLTGVALVAYQNYVSANGKVVLFDALQPIDADVLVDALLSTGLNRPVTGRYAEAIEAINACPAPVIAVDIPSGLNSDTGHVHDYAVKADCTVTFVGLKQGLFSGQAAEYCGEVFYTSLLVPDAVFQKISPSAYRVVHVPIPRRNRCAHKGVYGHVLVIGGAQGFMGAARLAAEAALRAGAGLVSIATRPEHSSFISLTRPEIMCHGIANGVQLLPLLKKATVIVIGPGLGQSEWAKDLLLAAILAKKLMVVDADALNILANTTSGRHTLVLAPNTSVLTPHTGEAARLLVTTASVIQQDRFAAVRNIQRKYGGVVILKGAGTLIASEDDLAISTTGNPGMASGGMGDVLSGIIGALLAQGLPLKDAAQQGVFLHGLAADLAAEKEGERGLLASDLMPYLRKLVN